MDILLLAMWLNAAIKVPITQIKSMLQLKLELGFSLPIKWIESAHCFRIGTLITILSIYTALHYFRDSLSKSTTVIQQLKTFGIRLYRVFK